MLVKSSKGSFPQPAAKPEWEERKRYVQAWFCGLLGAPLLGAPLQRLIQRHQQERGKCCKKGPFTHPPLQGV